MLQLKANNDSDEMPYIINGGLEDKYNFYQLHFHWGKDDSRGSEHRINGQRFHSLF